MNIRKFLMINKVWFITIVSIIGVFILAGILGKCTYVQAANTYGISNPSTDKDGNVLYDCLYFGSYWQTDTNGDGKADKKDTKMPIKWRVLSVDGNDAFLVADQILEMQNYNDSYDDVTWETCTIRSWLNGYGANKNICKKDYSNVNFIDAAFSGTEQTAIISTLLHNDRNPFAYTCTVGGNDTTDKIFLLSLEDISNSSYGFQNFDLSKYDWDPVGKEYCVTDSNKYCDIYDYAKLRLVTDFAGRGNLADSRSDFDTVTGYGRSVEMGTFHWLLRSSGYYNYFASVVLFDGDIGIYAMNNDPYAVCPALHLNLSYSNVWKKAESVTCKQGAFAYSAHTHTWDEGTVVRKPTCGEEGEKQYKCRNCSESKKESIASTGEHTWDTGKITKTPTENAEGVKTFTCTVCKAERTEAVEKIVSEENQTSDKTGGDGAQNPVLSTVAKVKDLKVVSKKKALSVSWKRLNDAEGYEIQYATKSNFKNAKKKVISKTKTSYMISKLKTKKKYYVRIRAYKNYRNGLGYTTNMYGKWSTVKKVKVK